MKILQSCQSVPRYLAYLASIFSTPFLRRLGDGAGRDSLREVLSATNLIAMTPRTSTVGQVFDLAYGILQRHYRCEYLYKNAIATKILLNRCAMHTSSLHPELQVGNSKADVVLVNGTTVAYEIKTELDSPDRLHKQLRSYQMAFDQVNVVTHESHADEIASHLPPGVGLLAFTQRGSLTCVSKADSNKAYISAGVVFDMLRRDEYVSILRRQGVQVPKVPNTMIYKVCRARFLSLPVATVHGEFVRALQERARKRTQGGVVISAPLSLKFHALAGSIGVVQQASFASRLFAD